MPAPRARQCPHPAPQVWLWGLAPPYPPGTLHGPGPIPPWNILEAWLCCGLSLVFRPAFQICVKPIIYLACARPERHHSFPPRRLRRHSFLFIEKEGRCIPEAPPWPRRAL